MSRDKHIEGIAKVIKSSIDGLGSGNFNFTGDEISTMFAEALYNEGYSKTSDVAKKIFEDIYKILEVDRFGEADVDIRELYELENKYTEGKNEQRKAD